MTKQRFLSKCAVVSVLLSCTLPSSNADAQFSGLGGGLGMPKSTLAEQLVQIEIMTEELEGINQMLSNFQLGNEVMEVINQMTEVLGQMDTTMNVRSELATLDGYETMNPRQAIARADAMRDERKELMGQLDELRYDILNPDQMNVLGQAMNLIVEPQSDIQAQQATFLAQAATIENERRAMALDLLEKKRLELEELYEQDNLLAQEALERCINTGEDCGS